MTDIPKKDWKLFLTRPFDLFNASLWNEWYASPQIEEMLGMRFEHGLFIEHPKGTTNHYRDSAELKRFNEALTSIVKDEARLVATLERGLALNQEAEKILTEGSSFDFRAALDFSIALGLYATVFPLLAGDLIAKYASDRPDVIQKWEKLRTDSYYPRFFAEVLRPLAEAALVEQGNAKEDISLVTAREILNARFDELLPRRAESAKGHTFVYADTSGKESVSYTDDAPRIMTSLNKAAYEVWIERRHHTPFLMSAFYRPEGPSLETLFGKGCVTQLYANAGGRSLYIRSTKELVDTDAAIAAFLSESGNRSSLDKWSAEGLKQQGVADELLSLHPEDARTRIAKDVSGFLSVLGDILFYSTSLPYFVLTAVEHARKGGIAIPNEDQVVELFETLRAGSHYPQLAERVFPVLGNVIETRAGLTEGTGLLLTWQEMEAICKGEEVTVPDIDSRKGDFLMECHSRDGTFEFTYSLERLDELGIRLKEDESIREFKGAIAYKGKATGTARIVNILADIAKVSEGDIVISINTNPSLMPALRLCGAIVTDEGGIACHAAIVARELKIPTITGTKIATKVIKDGDMVEVDATTGIVRLI